MIGQSTSVAFGGVKGFTGVDAPYEAPGNPELRIRTAEQTVDQAVELIIGTLGLGRE